MNKIKLSAISVSGGILTGLAWTSWCSGLVLLVSFVPFLYIENYLYENKNNFHINSVFVFILPGVLVFNIIALSWVHVASIVAAVFLITVSAFFMTFVIWLSHIVRLKAGNFFGILALIAFWLSLEFLNLTSDPFQPWLNLGNGLAKDIYFIQWYDTTGTAGGTIWILLSNILIATLIVIKNRDQKNTSIYFCSTLLILILIVPGTISFVKFKQFSQNGNKTTEVLIVQPNIDPYSEKFKSSFEGQLEKVLKMADTGLTENTRWILAPETIIDDPIDESDFNNNKYIIRIRKFLKLNPGVSIVFGSTSFSTIAPVISEALLSSKEINSPYKDSSFYNSALMADSGAKVSVYHKSKLVPGFEKRFTGIAGRISEILLPNLGGTQTGFTSQEQRIVFEHSLNGQKIAPIICYESVFGEFVTKYVNNGADFLFIITNDGWWKNTKGYKQHLSYASLRAIETRRSIARAANTGISCFIDTKGVIISPSAWWKPAIVKGAIYNETIITPYVRYGDYILRTGNILSIFIILLFFIIIPMQKRFNQTNK